MLGGRAAPAVKQDSIMPPHPSQRSTAIKFSPEEYKMKFEIENQWLLIAKKNRKVATSFWLYEQARLYRESAGPFHTTCVAC